MFCYCSGISIYLYFSLVVSYSHSHSLSLPFSLYSFCSGHNTKCDSGIFLGFALFGYCLLLLVFEALFVLLLFIRDHNTDCIFVGNCIVCLYCVSLFFIRDHYIDLDKPWNLCVRICIDCLYYVSLCKKRPMAEPRIYLWGGIYKFFLFLCMKCKIVIYNTSLLNFFPFYLLK